MKIDAIYLSRFHGGWRCSIFDRHKMVSDKVSKAWWGALWMAYRATLKEPTR